MLLPTLIDGNALEALVMASSAAPAGCFVEVGVYKGGSSECLYVISSLQGRELYLYDTFEGIPYQGSDDYHKVGDFCDTSPEAIQAALPNARVTKGVFPASALEMPPIAFAHLDCDQYQSVRDSILHLAPLMVEGGIMWFDGYNVLAGATRAVDEIFGDKVQFYHCRKAFVVFTKESH